MKNCSLALAWMLVGSTLFFFTAPETVAEDASKLPSVMVPPGTGASASTGTTPTGAAAVDPFPQTPGSSFSPGPVQPAAGVQGPESPAPSASEAPRWPPTGAAPGANSVPETNQFGVQPPQTLPDVGNAKPLLTPPGSPDTYQGAAGEAAGMTGDGKLKLPSPPGVEAEGERYRGAPLPDGRGSDGMNGRGSVGIEDQGSGVNPAQYHGELPPPANSQAKGAAPARLPGLPPPPGAPGSYAGTPPTISAPPANASAVDPSAQAAAHAAADLWKSSLDPKYGEGLVQLRYYLQQTPEPQRAAVTQGYWRLIRSVANYGWALDEQKRLEQIVPGRNSADGPMLSAARAAAAARVTEADLDFGEALRALNSTGPQFPAMFTDKRGLLFDTPLVGPYHTFYRQIFASRPNPRAEQIDHTLPTRQKSINEWVATVHSTTSAVHYAEQAHAKGEVDMRTVLACHDALREQRRKFLDAVMLYNFEIAEYAALAAPAGTSADKFVGMLIPGKGPERIGSLPGRPALPQGAGGLRQLPAGQQGASVRQLPWGDGWVASQQQPQRLQTPAQPSYGATGDWQGSAGAGSGDPRTTALPPSGTGANSNRPADPFAQPSSRSGEAGR
jgi:hypothetical protein